MSVSSFVRRSARGSIIAVVAGLIVAAGVVPTAQAAPTRAVSSERLVSRADVDGDGRADRTTLTRTTAFGDEAWRVTTRTARGATATTVVETPFLGGADPWHGAVGIDGQAGAEVVVRSGLGAHASFYRVLSWRAGELVEQPDPATGELDWVVDGALSISQGYRAETSRGRRVLTATTYARTTDADDARMAGTVRRFAWKRGAWRALDTRTSTVADDSPLVAAAYGWNVAGLPRD